MTMRRFLRVLFLCLFCATISAAEPGESVLVIYNSASAASREVAMHYAQKRKVPEQQVIAFDLPETETISRQDYKSKLQDPLWAELKKRKLFTFSPEKPEPGTSKVNITSSKIRYLVLCYGVPVKITADPMLQEEGVEKLSPELRRNEAAVDSELAALPALDLKLKFAGPVSNPLFGTTNAASLNPTNGILLVARLDGPTPEIARGLVDKALEAEQNGLWGRAYFDARGITNGSYAVGDQWIKTAAEMARGYGYDTVVDNAEKTFDPSFPMPNIALYFGWYDQNISGPFLSGLAEFRPGAVAYHLHSFSAKELRNPNSGWAGPLLARGATATMGCTEEPYLQATPEIAQFLYRFMYLGFSFGEAAYASQRTLSWQITVVGDPLYTPFSKNQKERYEDLLARKDKNLPWSMLMWVQFRIAHDAPLSEIETFYAHAPGVKESAILMEKLGDVYKSNGKLFDAVDAYLQAVKLPSTPLEKLRMTLSAGTLLANLGHEQEAYDLYKNVLEAFPGYPGKKDLYERLAKVALELKKTDEAKEYSRLAKES